MTWKNKTLAVLTILHTATLLVAVFTGSLTAGLVYLVGWPIIFFLVLFDMRR